jgi:tRNA threonylcarbamoyladenosine biosynthesis protein TsaB
MKILALELSSAEGSIAWHDGEEMFTWEWPNDRQNSAEFFATLEAVQKRHGAPDRVIVGLGPGSYAGTRIAISTAVGLSLGGTTGACPAPAERVSSQTWGRDRARPSTVLVGFPSICAIECEASEYCVVGDARRQSFFLARVQQNNLIDGPDLMTAEELRERLARETAPILAVEDLPQFENVTIRHPKASLLAQLAGEANRSFVLPPLEPMYLSGPHITVPKKQ